NLGRIDVANRLRRPRGCPEYSGSERARWTKLSCPPFRVRKEKEQNGTGNCEVVQRGEGLRLHRARRRLCGRLRPLLRNPGFGVPYPRGKSEGRVRGWSGHQRPAG